MAETATAAREVTVTLPDGAERRYPAGITPAAIAADISKSLAKAALAARIDGRLADLSEPIESDASLALVTAKDEAPALELIRHDAAHIMARAVQELWPDTRVTIGPVIENGWYYDFDRPEPFTPDDLGAIEARMRQIIAARDPVRTEVWDRDRAIAHYRATNEPFKVELVEAIPQGQPIRMYWHGHWQDLCRGPHLAHTGQVPADAFKLMSIAGAYWRGDSSAARCSSASTAPPSAPARTSRPTSTGSRRRRSAITASSAARWASSTSRRKPSARSSGTRTASRSGAFSRPTSAASSTPTAMRR
jgi:threonyl-tRNA synthetase